MGCRQLVFDLRGDDAADQPLMLRPLLFCPVLTWVCRELADRGVERFFIACGEKWRPSAEAAVSGFDATVLSASDPLPADALLISEPVLPLPSDQTPCGLTGFSSREELAPAVEPLKQLCAKRLARAGVTVADPLQTYVDPTCRVDSGTTLLPGTILRGSTHIGSGCVIGPNTMIRDSKIGKDCEINASQINESVIGDGTTVGPFAYVRPGCTVGAHCRVGDFVELKNSVIGDGTKISHLTYVGDSDVGQRVNFGCGTVTTNYDGVRKHRCTIGDDVFIGCNTNLVAPVTLGDGSYTAAGSTVTRDVPAGALAVARARQSNKDGWSARFMQRKKK